MSRNAAFFKDMDFTVIALGGSIIVPNEIDISYLKDLRDFVLREDKKFIIVAGGGKTARDYQRAASSISNPSDEELDWLGITASSLNARLLKSILPDSAIIEKESFQEDKSILIASGWLPGCSTDYTAVLLAKESLIIASNISSVYDKDPSRYDDARPLEDISWSDYRKMIPDNWSPGLSLPIDPVAAKLGEEKGLKAKVLDGRDLDNMRLAINGLPFRGTTISR